MSNENFYEFFGRRLKNLRKKKNVTQAEIAELLEVSPTTIVNYENGLRKMPLDMVVKVADYCKVSVDSLLGTKNKKTKIAQSWNANFSREIFTPEEMGEIINYVNYILYKRNEN